MTTYSALTDQELIALLKEGNEVAFEEFYNRFKPLVYRYALRICKREEDAHEIVQNVMLRVWKYRMQIDSEQNFKGWISRITTNLAFDFLKSLAKQQARQEQVWQQMQLLPTFSEDQYMLKEYLTLVEAVVSALPLQQQKVYRMSREEDLTYEEISQRLGISVHTVRNHMASALATIRNHVRHNTSAVLPPVVAICLLCGTI